MRDDDDGKPNIDSDRAAILARRKRFIALTLSGLATTACTTGEGDGADKQPTKTEPREPEAPPQPCLSIEPIDEPPQPETPPEPPPQPCLKVAAPDDTGETGEADEPPPPPEPEPKKPKPRPCLRQATPPPQPCLKVGSDTEL